MRRIGTSEEINGHPAAAFLSPSLTTTAPAFEMKFLLDGALAGVVEAWCRGRLATDPYADPALGGAYHTTTLYLDTPTFSVFHASGAHRRRKYRLRRYGQEPWAFLERKLKRGERVSKRRSRATLDELSILPGPIPADAWPGAWFQRRLRVNGVAPACLVAYERTAFVGHAADGPVRLTIDRNLRGVRADRWQINEVVGGIPFFDGQAICELKYRSALPGIFKELIADLRLTPAPVSKYRTAVAACTGLARRLVDA